MGRGRSRARGYRSWGTTPEAALGAQFLWDAARGVWADPGTGEVPAGDGDLVVALDEQVGSLLADRAVEANPATQYTWTEHNADFGGYPTIGSNSDPTRRLTATGSASVPQPFTAVIVGRWLASATQHYLLTDGIGAPAFRVLNNTAETVYYVHAGTAYAVVAGYQHSQAEALYVRATGAASTIEAYRHDGTRLSETVVSTDPGSNGIKGISWKNISSGTSGVLGQVALVGYVPGLLPSNEQTLFESWLRTAMPGWQP